MVSADLIDRMSTEVSKVLGRDVKLTSASGGGGAGGGGASISAVMDPDTNTKYFVKSASGETDMLRAEYLGIKEMSETNTMRVPTPIAFGQEGSKAFVVFEYLNFCGGGSGHEMGVQLAKMHRHVSEQGFGFHVDNTIGATPQPNLPWMDDWADFWDTHRLGHMLKLTDNAGYSDEDIEKLRVKTRELLSHKPAPSLLHGDLWSGNKSYAKEDDGTIVPVIFDPATYYGDREADIAMTYVFGGFGSDFYQGYESEWPLPEVRMNSCGACAVKDLCWHPVCSLFASFATGPRATKNCLQLISYSEPRGIVRRIRWSSSIHDWEDSIILGQIILYNYSVLLSFQLN